MNESTQENFNDPARCILCGREVLAVYTADAVCSELACPARKDIIYVYGTSKIIYANGPIWIEKE